MRGTFIILFILGISLTLSSQVDNYSAGYNGQKLDWLLFYLQTEYVDEVDNSRLADIAIERIVKELDPYSQYQNKEEVEAQRNADKGYSGKAAGFNFYFLKDTAIVTYVHSGGPAEEVGLKRGDQILSVNGKGMIGKKYKELKQVLNDPDTEALKINFKRVNSYFDIDLNKSLVPWLSVKSAYMIDNNLGYIKLSKFTMKTMEEFLASFSYLKGQGMSSMILDLRGNNGGVKDQALQLADQFLPAGKLIFYQDGENMEKEESFSSANGVFLSGKVVIIQDEYTASASEIFIGAMQDWDRAVILGKPSYGKGLVQQSYKLGDESNIRLTVGKYYTPTGRHLQRPAEEDDWLAPYKDALYNNSITSQLDVPAKMKALTKGGRQIIVGSGGIIPDVHYVPAAEKSEILTKLIDSGYLYEFAVDYVHANRLTLLAEHKTIKSFMSNRIFEAFMLQEMRRYLRSNASHINLPDEFPADVIQQVRKWIASLLWHDNAYYEVENTKDKVMYRAIEINKGKIHDNLGVTY